MSEQPKLKDKVQDALDETRTLILGTQVLLGFQYQATFEPGFERLGAQKILALLALLMLLANFAVLVLPIARGLLVDHGTATRQEYQFATKCVAVALPLFAVAIGINLELVASPSVGTYLGTIIGALSVIVSLALWFGLGTRMTHEPPMSPDKIEEVPLKDKIRQVLTESRVVLPGAQALLGFSATTTLLDSFASLPAETRAVHLASLLAVSLSTVLLMTPAATHRIAEHGEATERFYRRAGHLVLAALFTLAAALSAEIFVVFLKVTQSGAVSIAVALVCFAAMMGIWFVFPFALRRGRHSIDRDPR